MAAFLVSIWHQLRRGTFLTHVLILVGGTALSQALLFLSSPIITRLYTPDDFGAWSLIQSFSLIFSVVASWRYDVSIVLPENDEEAANLFAASVLISVGMSILLLLSIAFFGRPVSQLLGIEEIGQWLWLLPLMLLSTGLYQSSNFWSTRKQQFMRLAIATLTQASVTISTQIGVPVIMGINVGASGLIMGTIAGQLTGTGLLTLKILLKDGNYLWQVFSWISIKEVIYKYKNFPLYVAPYSFIGNAKKQLLLMLLGIYSTTNIVGLYALSTKILQMPISLIASALNQVFFPKASKELKSGDMEKFVLKAMRLLVIITTPIFSLFVFNSRWLFSNIFGANWTNASIYGVWLALPTFMLLYTSWLDRTYDILDRQRLALSMEIIYDILSVCLFCVPLIWMKRSDVAVATYSIVTTIYNAIWLVITFRVAKFSLRGLWQIIQYFISLFLLASLVHKIATLLFSEIGIVATDVGIAVVYYSGLCWNLYHTQKKRKAI
ncbi:MAG: oligosaccharide flippase family protein [Coleofasciculus sp. G3-WIS-01]|uniref:lipopolysaccharide biosynthesis protein n=1 Tax=Coleofasciculus sp. G3-WIS-01 TaxID=3069528 RepID=UPI0033045598